MKKSIVLILSLVLVFACSKDKSENIEGDFSISGKFVTPNSNDAISKASVKLYSNSTIVKETDTDSEGNFTLSGIESGEYELTIAKGLFTTTQNVILDETNDVFDITLDNIEFTSFPNIAVVTGSYDHIEDVLYNIGLVNPITQEPLFDIIDGSGPFDRPIGDAHNSRHQSLMGRNFNPQLEPNVDFDFGDLIDSPTLLSNYDIIFLNCGLDNSKLASSNNLTQYVADGGLLYATDWAYEYLNDITADGNQYLSFYNPYKSGESLSTEAEVFNTDLLDWLTLNYNITIENNTVTIDEFLPSWQVVDSYDETTVLPWLNGPITYNGITENKYLAYTFLHGNGGVLYSSFHTENETSDATTVERVMQYLTFELSDLKNE
ncbi:carboxypeptidase-like regulatory domain-containing protein [Winogradskyella sp. SYSU M77433]|uniref:carboxypeptidase-like regulatory domain-containing protein n=1 Tax=Winogradskyella sp. SYSU M77433 TaxID=3042722 RepID=UPI0024802C8C|nr:carboxypeptidase-like regulatory domain-containing protein [Winogradskyella sp. SYSU M77433]MDH7913996.1 carboxypeptidase-like regulatory domain-containing protein [Winogradskyella sp. SYSU M77433]